MTGKNILPESPCITECIIKDVGVLKSRAVIPLILEIAHPIVINVYVLILKYPTNGNITALHTNSHAAVIVNVSAPNCFVDPQSNARDGNIYSSPGKKL